MNRIFSVLLFSFFIVNNCRAQVTAGNDTTICQGTSITLHAESDSAGLITEFFNIQDDIFSPVVNIGFPFTYFGNTYTKCVLSTNDEITFDTTFAGQFSTWIPPGVLPNGTLNTILNSILGPFQDVLPGAGGIMSYATFGVAPNRFFVFNFCNSPMYQCTNINFTGQTIIYETSNIIETHITDKVTCPGWNSGQAIHGLQNIDGTVAFIVPGRNANTQWVTSNEGTRFTPDASGTTYTISTIPFAPIPMLGGVQWTDINGNQLATTQDFTVTPTTTTSYIATVQVCNGGTFADTVTVTVAPGVATFAHGNSTCPQSTDGFAAFIPQDSSIWHYQWLNSSGTLLDSGTITLASDTLFNITSGQYTLILVNTLGCTLTNNFNIQANTFVPPFQYSQGNTSCQQATDGFAVFAPQDTLTWQFQWLDSQNNVIGSGSVNQNSDTLNNISAGVYTLVLTNIFGCSLTHPFTITANPFNADFSVAPPVLCDGSPVNFINTSVGSVDTYHWNYGDGTSGFQQTGNHTYSPASNYSVTLTISNSSGCIDSVTKPISILPNIIANFSFFPLEGCVGSPIIFTDESNQFPTGWLWNFGDQETSTLEVPSHSFNADGQYSVTLTVTDSLCGTDSKTLPITIHFVPDVNLGNDTDVCKFESLHLDAGYPGTTYTWSTGETTQIINPPIPDHDTYFSVIVNNFGCLGYDTLLASINCDVTMPSSFTPNSDGHNDIFRPLGYRITHYDMVIYNRWGEIVYEINSPNISNGWNGKFNNTDAEVGVYVYYMNATFINGDKKSLTGNVTLLR